MQLDGSIVELLIAGTECPYFIAVVYANEVPPRRPTVPAEIPSDFQSLVVRIRRTNVGDVDNM